MKTYSCDVNLIIPLFYTDNLDDISMKFFHLIKGNNYFLLQSVIKAFISKFKEYNRNAILLLDEICKILKYCNNTKYYKESFDSAKEKAINKLKLDNIENIDKIEEQFNILVNKHKDYFMNNKIYNDINLYREFINKNLLLKKEVIIDNLTKRLSKYCAFSISKYPKDIINQTLSTWTKKIKSYMEKGFFYDRYCRKDIEDSKLAVELFCEFEINSIPKSFYTADITNCPTTKAFLESLKTVVKEQKLKLEIKNAFKL